MIMYDMFEGFPHLSHQVQSNAVDLFICLIVVTSFERISREDGPREVDQHSCLQFHSTRMKNNAVWLPT